MAILELHGIRKNFGGLHVLRDINLAIEPGEKHAIIGPNGAGKSTLFHIVSGRLRASSGEVLFQQRPITNMAPHTIARAGIGRSFQIINVFPKLTVQQNLRAAVAGRLGFRLGLFRSFDGIPEVNRRAEEILEMVSLGAHRNALATELAYGEQRRLELGLTAATDPEVFLLDEPCAGLNADDTAAAIDLIRQVIGNKTLVIVEHDMNVVFGLADRVSVLHQGHVLLTGTPEEVRTDATVKNAYLGKKFDAA